MKILDIIENSELQPQNLTVEELFHILLHELGFSFKIQGTHYLEELFSLAYEKYESKCDLQVMELYKEIATIHNMDIRAVSRSISYCITVAWNKGNVRLQNELFGYTLDPDKGKPSPQEFLCLTMDLLKL